MLNRRTFLSAVAAFAVAAAAVAAPALAQYTGPSVQGTPTSVAEVQNARVGTYVTLEGNIVAHLREDHYRFSDGTGDIRVEIPQNTFGGQKVGPDSKVRLMGEVDTGFGGRYVWVKSLTAL